jgi:flagellin-like hook-associated protein FlgL
LKPNTADVITTPAFVVVVKDSAGNVMNASAVPTVTSSDPLVSTGGTCALDDGGDSTYSSSTNGIGYYNCSFSTVATAVSGAKATLTISIPNPASTTGGTLDATYAITVGGAAATQTLTLDKATYEQGEGIKVTRGAVDASGNPVYDGLIAPAVTFNRAIGGTAPGAAFYIGGTTQSNNSLGAATVFAPTSAGAFTATITGKVAAANATITATATVADDAATTAAAAAGDAAAEATDAANAATDAANAAAEAADAATAAAQDAADAVAALSTSVTAMVDALRKQITSLTNLVIKIQKKVKA